MWAGCKTLRPFFQGGAQHIMYEKRTLPNGVRMVYEHMPHVRSAAIGVWIGVGSRYELSLIHISEPTRP